MSFVRICHAVLRGALLVLAVILPLAYFPWTYEPLEINKQTVAILLIVLAALAWLGASIAERRVLIRGEWLLGVLLLFVVVPFLSAGTFDQPYMSFIGASGQEYTSVLTIALLVGLVFLAPAAWSDARSQVQLWSGMLFVGGLIALLLVFTAFGIALPSFIGSANSTALYLLGMTLLGSTLWLTSRGGEGDVLPEGVWGIAVRSAIIITSVVTLWMLLSIDVTGLWVVALIGTCAMFAFALVRAHEFPHLGRFLLPMMIMVASLIFIFAPSLLKNAFVPEVTLTQRGAWSIAGQTLASHSLFFGSGPGTYAFDYAAYHSADVNASDFWDVTFDRANSHIMTVIPTYGVVGTMLYLIFLLGIAGASIGLLARARSHEEWKLIVAPFVAWLAMTVAQFVTPMNMTLQFMYWLLSAVLLVHLARNVRQYDFAKSPRAGIVSSLIFMLLFAGLAMTLFVTAIRYRAEIAFAEAVALDKASDDLDSIILLLDRAASSNSWNDVYYRNLGHALLLRTGEFISEENVDPGLIQQFIAASLNAGKMATDLSSSNAVNWELRGSLYREVAPLIAGADVAAIDAWQRAVTLAPNNPKEYVGLARAYMARADRAAVAMQGEDEDLAATATTERADALTAAVDALLTAQTLKADYTPAQYYLAQVYERQEKLADAVKSMETLKASAPLDIGVAMQLGLLYMRQGKHDAAKAELERAIEIAPNYANAHWYLASIYEQEGDIAAAIAEVEKIMVSDPDNALVTQRLERLSAGLSSSHLPVPVEEGDGSVTEGDGSTASQTEE